jgi:filamentous hemagglutinin family protein
MKEKNPVRNTSGLITPVRLGVAAVAACFIAGPALSNPVNPTVVNGTATFNQAGNVLTVTNSNGAIINWDKFSIKAGETTHFAQTSASSSVLNRVLNDPTAIYGTLSSNGRVWLVNPAGIMVGAGGRIDVAGFVASTLNISNADFLAGRNLFANDGTAQNVINQGEIKTPSGGSVYLIGSNVSNEGIIHTPQGETILAAGQTVSLIDSATPGVKVDITGAAGNATNLGQITAEAGRIGIAGVIVRNSGTLNASSVVSEGGRVFLKASQDAYVDGSGRIVTTGTRGGHVEVLGNRVALMDNASIDASGESGGGRILIGGDYQGKNPDIQNANITYVGAGTTLKADATDTGDGGSVIVWADDTTRAYGRIFARGGANGGNGGFVETSGHRYLDVAGARVDTRALNGTIGNWLLDPDNITIVGSSGSDINIVGAGSPFTHYGAGSSTITDTTINTTLGSTNVSILASNDILFDGSTNGAIVIDNPSVSPNSLTLNAGNDIIFTSGTTTFENSGGGDFAVNFNPASGRNVTIAVGATATFLGDSGLVAATVTGAGSKTWENYGTVNLNGNSYIDLHDGADYSAFNNKSGGVLNVNSSHAKAIQSEAVTPNGVLNNAGTINVSASTSWEAKFSQTSTGILNINGSAGLNMPHLDVAAGTINLNSAASYALTLPSQFSGLSTFYGASIVGVGGFKRMQIGTSAGTSNAVTFNTVSTSGGLEVVAPELGTLSFTGANTFANTKFFKGDTGANKHWVIPVATYLGNVEWWATGNISFAGNVSFGGSVTLGAGWNSNLLTPVVTAGAGSIQVIDRQILSSGNMTLKAGGDILVKRNLMGSTWVHSAAAMAVETSGDLTLVNDFDPGGSVELKSAGNQSIQLNGALSDLVVQASNVGAGGFTRISSGGTQTINFAAGVHTLVLTGGMDLAVNASGAGASIESAGAQTILNGGTLAINITGGNVLLNTQSSYDDYGLPSQRLICAGCATHNSAQIRSKSSQTIAATTITIVGGSGGNGNHAGIDADGASTIVAAGAVSITGGSSGGLYVGGIHDDYVQNDAGISANGALNLTAASITLAGGSASYGGAYIGGGSSVTVNTSGNLTLNGGTTAAQGAALTYADASPVAMKWLAPAVIGSDAGSLVTINLNVGGDLTLNGGAVGQDGGSMALIGGVRSTPINLVINSQGAIAMNSASALSDRIGSKAGGTFVLNSGLGGTGSMTLGKGLIGSGYGMGGSVQLYSTGTGPGIFQNAAGMIVTDQLSATTTGAGSIDLVSFENRVGNFDATTSNGLVTFKGQSIGLGTINSGTGGAIISALYDIHDNNGSALNISGPTVNLTSSLGGSAGSRAISADVAATASIVAQVNSGAANGGIRIANTSAAQPTSVTLTDNASAGTSASFSQKFTGAGTLAATNMISLTALYGGDISLLSNDGLDYSSATFNTGGAGSIGLSASGLLAISAPLSLGNDDLLLAGSTVNIAAQVATTADLIVAGSSVNINSSVSALDIGLVAGSLTVGNTGGLLATNSLVAVVTGDVNINGGYIKTSAGDLEMLIGGDLNIGNASYGGDIWAGYNKMSPYFPDASIAVGGNLTLNNGGHIKAANDIFIDLLGANSVLALNTGVLGPSYILSDIGTGVMATTHLTFLTRNSGGILIDGVETTKTVVGGSGFFAVNSSTPALPGAGLEITFASQASDSIAAQLVNALSGAVDDASTSETPTEAGLAPKFETAKGEEGGDKEGGFGDDEDKDKKKSDDPKDGKKDDKPASKKASQCT